MSLNVVIAGASGLLGSHLSQELIRRNHAVIALVRRPTSAPDESSWDPHASEIDQSVIDAADVVVNTAGSPLFGNPHSQRWRTRLRDSRVRTTDVLARAIARSGNRPVFLVQNATGWYGDHGNDAVTEESPSRGDTLMTGVCRDWQAAADPAVEAGARVCILRTAPVMDGQGMTLRILKPMFQLFLGARLGSGEQYFPVVSVRDWVAAAILVLEDASISGPVNVASPDTPTNAEFTKALADAVHRKAFLFAPAPFLKVAAGPAGPELLNSTHVRPAVLEATGYKFRDRDVSAVFAAAFAAKPR